MDFNLIEKSNTPLKIAQQILRHLETGELVPGDKLPSERSLCVQFGVGRSSVREAIRVLAALGYLESKHGKGTFLKAVPMPDGDVTEDTAAHVEYLLEAWELISTGLTRMAAERSTPEVTADMERLLSVMAESESVEDYWNADYDFQLTVAYSTGNTVLVEILRSMLDALSDYKTYFLTGLANYRQELLRITADLIKNIELHHPVQAAVDMRKRIGLVIGSERGEP
ncbi:MAG: GntR family transcriptional regulator [Clostridiales bacterium]|jgi:GntR family transcriptional repressor for pyruvate dehydrogenase complex|nr:GntR family transcriptional regulator [Clostridiales bacterium]